MPGVHLTSNSRALVYDRTNGRVHDWDVPTAIENVERDPVRYGHGAACPPEERTEIKAAPVKAEAAIPLKPPGALPLPAAEDPADIERAEVIADLTARGIGFFKGAPTETLKAKLAEAA